MSASTSFGDFITIVIALITITIVYVKWRLNYWKRKNIPSVSPILNIKNYKIYNEDDYKRHRKLGNKCYGTYIGITPALIAVDPDFIKTILVKDFNYFNDRGFFANPKDDPLSYDFSHATGNDWKMMRTRVTPAFTTAKTKLLFDTVLKTGEILTNNVEQYAINNIPIDTKECMARFTTDVIGSAVFGIEFNSLKDPDSKFRYYGKKMFNPSTFLKIKRTFLRYYPSIGLRLRMLQIDPELSDFILNLVKKSVEYRETNNFRREDFLQALLDIRNSNKGSLSLTVENIAAQLYIFFAAGHETSASVITFALYELARHRDIQNKVRDDIDSVLELFNNELTYEAIAEMKYLGQVVDETMRMYPSLLNFLRRCTEDYNIPDTNITIDKGTIVAIPLNALHHDEQFYPEADKFDPERFNSENLAKRHSIVYMPFGDGPRLCIGMRFAMMLVKIGLIELLRNFEFTVNEKTKPVEYDFSSVGIVSVDPIYLNVQKLKK